MTSPVHQGLDRHAGLISIVMPYFNAETFLKQAIDSVFAHSYKKLELIVVDDGSTDSSREILRSYGDSLRLSINRTAGRILRAIGRVHQ